MKHRHLDHEGFSPAAVDDIIARGGRSDWAVLRRAALSDELVMKRALRVSLAHTADPYAQRYHFWKNYAEQSLASHEHQTFA